jgi:hypothetical protein
VKQFVRFTDFGHIVSFIYFFYPKFFPVAHNIHFTITIGYWVGKLGLNEKDTDFIDNPEKIEWMETACASIVHAVPYILYIRELIQMDKCYEYFSYTDLLYSYYWCYIWWFMVYVPWRYITNDSIYDILIGNTITLRKVLFILFIHILIFSGNTVGYGLQYLQNNVFFTV